MNTPDSSSDNVDGPVAQAKFYKILALRAMNNVLFIICHQKNTTSNVLRAMDVRNGLNLFWNKFYKNFLITKKYRNFR